MAAMGYDAVCVGDEELGFGLEFLDEVRSEYGLSFLSVNLVCVDTGEPVVAPYLLKEVAGTRVAILGVTTPEVSLSLAERPGADSMKELEVREPVEAVTRYVEEVKDRADLLVVLSHLGEEESRALAEMVPWIDVIVNGHRRHSGELSAWVGDTFVVQFSYRGRGLGVLRFADDLKDVSVEEIPLAVEVPEDPEVGRLVEEFRLEAEQIRARLDLYVMPGCDFCLDAERTVHRVLEALGDRVDVRVYYAVDKGEELEALRGIAVSEVQPDRFWTYLLASEETVAGMAWSEIAAQVGLDTERIAAFVRSGEADEILRSHLFRAERLGTHRLPALYVSNQPYEGPIEYWGVMRALSRVFPEDGRPEALGALPECFGDGDCPSSEGYVGICERPGTPEATCVYREAVGVPFTVIYDERAFFSNEEEIVASTRSMFPGVQVERVSSRSEEGGRLIERYGIRRLPAYLFGREVLDAYRLPRVRSSLRWIVDRFVLDPQAVGANVDPTRPEVPGRIDLFLSSLSPRAYDVALDVEEVLAERDGSLDLRVHYLAYEGEDGRLAAPGGRFEVEEAIRHLVIWTRHPGRYFEYLRVRKRDIGSSYWEDGVRAVGIDPEEVRRIARSPEGTALLEADVKLAEAFGLGGDLAFVLNNREAAYIEGPMAFRDLVERLIREECKDE